MVKFNNLNLLCIAVIALLLVCRVSSFTTPTRGNRNSSLLTKVGTQSPPSITTTTSTLSALPTWAYYSIGHIIGGTTGTPIVVSATKSWYSRIPLPSFTPPNFIFGPVWTLLYGLMGVSISRIVKVTGATSPLSNIATKLWTLHYALNLIWAPVFFGFQYLRLGFIINVLLVGSLGIILNVYRTIDPLSAYLQIPYMLWLIFATFLNLDICRLNPVVDGVNEAKLQAKLCASGDGYNDAMLQFDIKKLQAAAVKYADS